MSFFTKKHLALVALSGLLVAVPAGVASAQPVSFEQGPPPGGPGGGRMGGPTLEILTSRLKLTDDQQTKIKPILAERDEKMKALRADDSMEMQDRMSKMMKIRTDTDSKINAVLTDDQKTEYAKMNEEMRQRRGGGGPPPPPQ